MTKGQITVVLRGGYVFVSELVELAVIPVLRLPEHGASGICPIFGEKGEVEGGNPAPKIEA